MHDVIIIGGGLFGCIIGKTLRQAGKHVQIIEGKKPGRASPAAACLMKPGWFSGFSPEEVKASLGLLDELYGVKEIPFTLKGLGIKVPKPVPVYWVDPEKILSEHMRFDNVLAIHKFKDYMGVNIDSKEILHCKTVIVAAGIWSHHFVKDLVVEPKAGVVFRSPGHTEPVIDVWAPYKQLVAFNITPDTVWAGDGTAMKPENLGADRLKKSAERCQPYLSAAHEAIVGYRPYVKDAKPAHLREHSENVWCATGGAKNGTIAAAWCALKLREALV